MRLVHCFCTCASATHDLCMHVYSCYSLVQLLLVASALLGYCWLVRSFFFFAVLAMGTHWAAPSPASSHTGQPLPKHSQSGHTNFTSFCPLQGLGDRLRTVGGGASPLPLKQPELAAHPEAPVRGYQSRTLCRPG